MSPFAKFSPENRIRDGMTALGVSSTFTGAITKISQTRLSHALAGIKPLGSVEAERAVEILDELVQLQKKCDPIPVKFTSAIQIDKLLSLLRNNKLFVVVGGDHEAEDVSADAESADAHE